MSVENINTNKETNRQTSSRYIATQCCWAYIKGGRIADVLIQKTLMIGISLFC